MFNNWRWFYFFSVISFSFIPNINSFVRGSLPPLIIILSLFLSIIMTYLSSKIAKHTLSQNDPIDTNACFKSKKIWSFLASKGIYLLGNLPIYVDLMISSAGNFTSIGIIAFLYWSLLIHSAWNWPLFLNTLLLSSSLIFQDYQW